MNVHKTRTLDGTAQVAFPELFGALCDTKIATAKAQTYHWNVTGMAFQPLHTLFQEIYEDHFVAQDLLAERLRALGGFVDGRLATACEFGSLEECDGMIPAKDMVHNLANDQRRLSQTMLNLAKTASAQLDEVTNDVAIERAGIHDKFAWMLSAHLAD